MADPFAARLKELQAPAADPFAARLEELQQVASASGAPSDVAAEPETPEPPRKLNFVERAAEQIGEGVGHIGNVAVAQGKHLLDLFTSPIETTKINWSPEGLAQHGAERRELLRGMDDITMLGHGRRIAARAGNALGDVGRGTSLDETRHFSTDPLQGNIGGPSKVEAADQASAPDVRPATQLIGSFLTPNPTAEGVNFLGKTGAALVSRAAPQAMAKVLRVAQQVPAPVRGLAAYEATAPVAAGLSADAEGNRLEAAKQAAQDPMGTSLSTILPGLASGAKKGVLNSRGGEARRFIEEHGNGAKVGLTTSGRGGVFDAELAGVPANDRGIGIAGKRGAGATIDALEQAHAAERGYDYREGPLLEQRAAQEVKDTNRSAAQDMRVARRETTNDIVRAERDAREHAQQQAPELLAGLDERHRVEGSEPYRVLSEQIDQHSASMPPRNADDLVAHIDSALADLETPGDALATLGSIRTRLENFRDEDSGRFLVPERQLNGLRRNLMDLAKIGTTDAPRGHDAPLRAAAFKAKELVDQGPYAALNQLYAESASAREAGREALGMPGRLGRDRALEERALGGRMVRSVNEPTAMPAEAPPEASMAPYRERIEGARANLGAVREGAEARQRAALADQAATRDRVAAGSAAAVPDRRLLGLNDRIGPRKTDVNQTKLAFMRESQNTPTAGGNPADLDAFRQAHPELALNTRLAALQNAKADLTFSPFPVHGGITAQIGGGIAGPLGFGIAQGLGHHGLASMAPLLAQLGLVNRNAITGRVLYKPAQKINPINIARALGVSRAAASTDDTLGAKVKAAIEAKKMEQQP